MKRATLCGLGAVAPCWTASVVSLLLTGAASTAAAGNPTVEACIAYAEADVARGAAINEAEAPRDAAYAAADAAYEAAVKEAEAAREAAYAGPRAAHLAAMKEARGVSTAAYVSIYENDGGKQSDVESITFKLLVHHRKTCRTLYGI